MPNSEEQIASLKSALEAAKETLAEQKAAVEQVAIINARIRKDLESALEGLRETSRSLAASVEASAVVQQRIDTGLVSDRELFNTSLQSLRDRIQRTHGELAESNDRATAV